MSWTTGLVTSFEGSPLHLGRALIVRKGLSKLSRNLPPHFCLLENQRVLLIYSRLCVSPPLYGKLGLEDRQTDLLPSVSSQLCD